MTPSTLANFIAQTHSTAFLKQDAKVFLAPNIPRNKLYVAMSAYVPSGVEDEDILILMDDTVFGSAKDGLVLTDQAIYLKEAFGQPRQILLKDINSIHYASEFLSTGLYINGHKVTGMTQPAAKSIEALAQLMNDFLQINQQQHKQQTTQNTGHASFGNEQLNRDAESFYPLVDIICHYATLWDGYWTAENSHLVSDMMDTLFQGHAGRELLFKRINISERPSLDQAIRRFMHFHAEDRATKAMLVLLVGSLLTRNEENLDWAKLEIEQLGEWIGLSKRELREEMDKIEESMTAKHRTNQRSDQQSHSQHNQQQQKQTRSRYNADTNSPSAKHPDVAWACSILHVSELSINRDSIQQAYRLKVKEFHPDKYQNLPESVQQILNEKTQEVNKAKDILMSHYGA